MKEEDIKVGTKVLIPTQKTAGHLGLDKFLINLNVVNTFNQDHLYVTYIYKKYFDVDYNTYVLGLSPDHPTNKQLNGYKIGEFELKAEDLVAYYSDRLDELADLNVRGLLSKEEISEYTILVNKKRSDNLTASLLVADKSDNTPEVEFVAGQRICLSGKEEDMSINLIENIEEPEDFVLGNQLKDELNVEIDHLVELRDKGDNIGYHGDISFKESPSKEKDWEMGVPRLEDSVEFSGDKFATPIQSLVIINDSKSNKPENGLRYNEGKLDYTLMDLTAFSPMIEVLEFGKNKYTNFDVTKLEQRLKQWNVKFVTKIEKLELRDYVALATKPNSLILIQRKEKELELIKNNTELIMALDYVSSTETGKKNVKMIQSIRNPKEIHTILEDTESQQKSLIREKNKVVNFVAESKPLCTQTITMKLENSEVSFVAVATTGLDSSMIMLSFLEKLLNISLPESEYLFSGRDNWKAGGDNFTLLKLLGSTMRHLALLLSGELFDDESKLSHIGHIQCNLMFMGYFWNQHLKNKKGKKSSNFLKDLPKSK